MLLISLYSAASPANAATDSSTSSPLSPSASSTALTQSTPVVSPPTSVKHQPLLKDKLVTLSDSPTDNNKELLTTIARATLRKHFGLENTDLTLSEFANSFALTPAFRRRTGLFVTLSKNGQTRACWGSLDARFNNLVQATVFTTEQALTDEYRFRKITASEIDGLKPQVTVVNAVEPLHNLSEQNPRLWGMFVRSGGKAGVILAGETTDPFYQLVQCKLKAGIKRNEPCQIYRIKADEYR